MIHHRGPVDPELLGQLSDRQTRFPALIQLLNLIWTQSMLSLRTHLGGLCV
jgi:hypothetical protein